MERKGLVIAERSAQGCSRFLYRVNRDEPFRLHATEVGAHMVPKFTLRVEHNRPTRSSPKHHPMPERTTPFSVPFDGEQRKIRQGVP